jgi:hypothetical protein
LLRPKLGEQVALADREGEPLLPGRNEGTNSTALFYLFDLGVFWEA